MRNLKTIHFSYPVIFSAPLCGFTRYPFRKILTNFPLDLIFTEMVSIDALYYQNQSTLPLLAYPQSAVPTAVQLVGSKIDFFVHAVRTLQNQGFFSFDINLGCPVKKILKNQAGSALLKDPEKIYTLFKTLTNTFPNLIFSGKIRLGFSKQEQNYLETSKAVEEGGASWITVHGRTRCQMYEGDVNLKALAKIKKSLNIPVIGNGNVFTPKEAKEMIEQTQCDGIMVARGILGNPWLISQIKDYLKNGIYQEPSLTEKIQLMIKNFHYEEEFDPLSGYREFKKIAVKYLKGFPLASTLRQKILLAKNPLEMKQLLLEIKENIQE